MLLLNRSVSQQMLIESTVHLEKSFERFESRPSGIEECLSQRSNAEGFVNEEVAKIGDSLQKVILTAIEEKNSLGKAFQFRNRPLEVRRVSTAAGDSLNKSNVDEFPRFFQMNTEMLLIVARAMHLHSSIENALPSLCFMVTLHAQMFLLINELVPFKGRTHL